MVKVWWTKVEEQGPTEEKPKFPKRDSKMWIEYSKEVIEELDKINMAEMDVDEQCDRITMILKESAKRFPKCKPIARGIDNRRVRRWLKDRMVLVERLSSHDTGSPKLMRVCKAYKEDCTLRGILASLKIVDGLVQVERARRANKRFSKWLYKARTTEFVDPRFFFNAATGKKALSLRFKSYKSGEKVITAPEKVAEHAADYLEEVFEQEFADMTFLDEMRCRTESMEDIFPPFKLEEVLQSLKWLRNGKAPGVDKIFNAQIETHQGKRL